MRRLEERLNRMEERHAMEIRNLKVQVHEKDLAMLNMMEKMGDDLSIGLCESRFFFITFHGNMI